MSGNADGTKSIRVSRDVYDKLLDACRKFYATHNVMPTPSEMIGKMLADREAWRAMGEVAREADRKPVPS